MDSMQLGAWIAKFWRTSKPVAIVLIILIPFILIASVVVNLFGKKIDLKVETAKKEEITKDTQKVVEDNKKVQEQAIKTVTQNEVVVKTAETKIEQIKNNIEKREEKEKDLFK